MLQNDEIQKASIVDFIEPLLKIFVITKFDGVGAISNEDLLKLTHTVALYCLVFRMVANIFLLKMEKHELVGMESVEGQQATLLSRLSEQSQLGLLSFRIPADLHQAFLLALVRSLSISYSQSKFASQGILKLNERLSAICYKGVGAEGMNHSALALIAVTLAELLPLSTAFDASALGLQSPASKPKKKKRTFFPRKKKTKPVENKVSESDKVTDRHAVIFHPFFSEYYKTHVDSLFEKAGKIIDDMQKGQSTEEVEVITTSKTGLAP